jgi:two-component system phosphate regulon sensor histidine kinase PhoR
VDGRDLVLRALPLEDAEGCMGVVLDVTSVRAAEKARRDFVANVSHELRTPVTAILGWSEALVQERGELPAHVHDMVDAIDRNARRLGLLIEDVLHLSRIEARRADLHLEEEELAPLVDEVVARHRGRPDQAGVALRVDVPAAVAVPLNAEAFEHALGNLVDNALKYTPRGGAVVVAARCSDDHVDVTVSDTGIGIDVVHHARIFERFYRVDAGRDRAVGGTGLGLALVKHLCRAMRADVVLESRPGEGSTFTIRLPARHLNVTRRT